MGIRTSATILPMLPKAEELAFRLSENVDCVLIDRINYHYNDLVYKNKSPSNQDYLEQSYHDQKESPAKQMSPVLGVLEEGATMKSGEINRSGLP